MKRIRAWMIYSAMMVLALIPAFLIPIVRGQESQATGEQPAVQLSEESQACMACHSGDMEEAPKLDLAAFRKSPHAEQDCQSCHSEYTPDYPHTPAMKASRTDCATCHSDVQETLATSVHSRPNKDPGDHPTCQSCHIPPNTDPHAIEAVEQWSRAETTQQCSTCHSSKSMMARYGVDPEAVSSYHASFHGKALMKFGYTEAAGCVDCHNAHNVLAPGNPAAPTHPDNRAEMCAKCHAGAKVNFAMSGANHLSLRLKTSPLLFGIFWFFRVLVFGMLVVLMLGVALDLRRRVFGPHPPGSGRLPAIFVALSFILFAATLLAATFQIGHTMTLWIVSLVLLAMAFLVYFITRPKAARANGQPRFRRLSLVLRIQHAIMAIAFTLLALTGLPQRFSGSAAFSQIYLLFGGFQNARMVHRGAALVLITVWVWHMLWLLYRWSKTGFSFKAWTMLPNKKDLADVIQLGKFHLGISHEEPKWDRFQFKGKMDYFAEYWGMPVMVISGFILWFPIYWGNRLPDEALSLSIIAHSYEATLAFLSIVTWHMYNAHFNPEHFPMNPTWLTGEMTRDQMAHEHPLELERIEAGEKPAEQAEAGGPIPQARPDDEFGVYRGS